MMKISNNIMRQFQQLKHNLRFLWKNSKDIVSSIYKKVNFSKESNKPWIKWKNIYTESYQNS